MRKNFLLALLLIVAAPGPAALAQQAPEVGGIRSETQRRLANQGDPTGDFLNWLGVLGLLGLLGLKKEHDEDSYHPASID